MVYNIGNCSDNSEGVDKMQSEDLITKYLLEMKEAIIQNDRKLFLDYLHENRGKIRNIAIGNDFLIEKVNKVYREAMEKLL